MSNQTPRTDEWEAYCDECYYHMWRLRRKTERGWYDGFHIHTGEEAKGLCDLLNNLESELTTAREEIKELDEELHTHVTRLSNALNELTEQRDRLAEALRKIKKAGGTYNDPYDELDFIDGVTFEALQSLNQPEP